MYELKNLRKTKKLKKNLRKNERKKRLTLNDLFFKHYFPLLANNLFEKRVTGKVLEIRGSESRNPHYILVNSTFSL
jgi:hypothetical protein